MKISIIILVLSALINSCTFHKSIYENKIENHNQVAAFSNPKAEIEASAIGEISYYAAPVIGGALGYYQNVIKFYPNDNKANQISGALLGGITGVIFSYSYNKIMGHGNIYPIIDNVEMQKKWLDNLNTKQKSNYTLVTLEYNKLLAIPKAQEFDYNIHYKNDYQYFALAFPNSQENIKIITKSFEKLGVYIAPDLKKYYPNDIPYIQMEHLRTCNTVEDCYDYAEQNKEFYSLADAKADSLAVDRVKKDTYLRLFSEGKSQIEFKTANEQEDFNKCKSIPDFVAFIDFYNDKDILTIVKDAKARIIENLEAVLKKCVTSENYENYILKFKEQKFGSNSLLQQAKESAYKVAFNECKTVENYEKYITDYEKKEYSSDISLITKAKENAYRLAYQRCSSITDYENFLVGYVSKNYSKDNSLIENAKLNSYQLSFDACSTIDNYQNFINKYTTLNYDIKKLITKANKRISEIKLDEYSNDFKNCKNSYSCNQFISKYTSLNYDPKNLIAKAKTKSDQYTNKENADILKQQKEETEREKRKYDWIKRGAVAYVSAGAGGLMGVFFEAKDCRVIIISVGDDMAEIQFTDACGGFGGVQEKNSTHWVQFNELKKR